MKVSFTSKSDQAAYAALRLARLSVHNEIDELIRGSNIELPDVELILCPLAFPNDHPNSWKEKIRHNGLRKRISIELPISYEALLKVGPNARATYARWVKSALLSIENKYPQIAPARQLLDRLTE